MITVKKIGELIMILIYIIGYMIALVIALICATISHLFWKVKRFIKIRR